MRVRCFAALFLAWVLVLSEAAASDLLSISHQPPAASLDGDMELRIPAVRVDAARVLVAAPDGYRVVPMTQEGGEFVARVSFGALALLRYQFQLHSGGTFIETEFFEIRQPSDSALEDEIVKLDAEVVSLTAQRTQLENTVSGLQRVDPTSLTKRKNQEMAKALLALSQAERELASLTASAAMTEGGTP